jgi:hypothetical protein
MSTSVYIRFTLKVERIGSVEIFASIPESKAEKLKHLTFYISCLYIIDTTWVIVTDFKKMHDEEARDSTPHQTFD